MKKITSAFLILLVVSAVTGSAHAAEPPPGQTYIVQTGDWLSRVAERYLGNTRAWVAIVEATNAKAEVDASYVEVVDPDVLRVGQKLWIPETAVIPAPAVTDVHFTTGWSDTLQEGNTARYFDEICDTPPLLTNFLIRMPKGGDLHIHLSGAVYAESYIAWAAEDGKCFTPDSMIVSSQTSCDTVAGQIPMNAVLDDDVLYREVIDNWSMRNWELYGNSGHDHFFDAFGKYGDAKDGRTAEMLAQVTSRAASENLYYLELMVTLTDREPRNIVEKVGWDDDFAQLHQSILDNGLRDKLPGMIAIVDNVEAEYRGLLGCDTDQPDPGCDVTVRYVHQVKRYRSPDVVFVEMLAGFELAELDSRIVSLNLVAPEDGIVAMRDYTLHMEMLGYLAQQYPDVKTTMHAGELWLGMVPPEALRFHVREAVEIGLVSRVGHGVDIMYEDDATALLQKMAEHKVVVEILLSSNDQILGVSGNAHPLPVYLDYGVPLVIATDDPAISRSTIYHEYQRAVETYDLDYRQVKTIVRNSLEYAFVEGDGLWKDYDKLEPVALCVGDPPAAKQLSEGCQQYVDKNLKAKLQMDLEQTFWEFESEY